MLLVRCMYAANLVLMLINVFAVAPVANVKDKDVHQTRFLLVMSITTPIVYGILHLVHVYERQKRLSNEHWPIRIGKELSDKQADVFIKKVKEYADMQTPQQKRRIYNKISSHQTWSTLWAYLSTKDKLAVALA